MSRALILFAALLLLVALASAQEINIAIGLGGRPAPKTIFEEIDDAGERQAFRELWNAAPRAQIDLATRYVEQYPRSIVLREAYELAARAYIARRRSRPRPDVGSARPQADAGKPVSSGRRG